MVSSKIFFLFLFKFLLINYFKIGHQSSIHSLNIQNDSPSLLFSADETGVVCIWGKIKISFLFTFFVIITDIVMIDLRASSSSSTSNTSNSFTTTNTKPSQRGLVSKTNISASVLSSNLLTRSNKLVFNKYLLTFFYHFLLIFLFFIIYLVHHPLFGLHQ